MSVNKRKQNAIIPSAFSFWIADREAPTVLEPALLEDLVKSFTEGDVVLILGTFKELLQLVLASPTQLLLLWLVGLLRLRSRGSLWRTASSNAASKGMPNRVALRMGNETTPAHLL